MKITKRNGDLVLFDASKISTAITKSFVQSKESNNLDEDVQKITDYVIKVLISNNNGKKTLSVEQVQDYVEIALMRKEFYKTAKLYILYRSERSKVRSLQSKLVSDDLSLLVKESSKYFDNDSMREFVYYRTYSKWLETKNRREVWSETVERYMNFMKNSLGDKLTSDEYNEVHTSILCQDVVASMRLFQFSGPAAERCNVCVYNCAFTAPECFKDLADIMYISMSGTGMGFSVEATHVNKFPVIQSVKFPLTVHNYIIADSKEGWCDAFEFALNTWYEGEDVKFDYSNLRPAGARLKTMGGRSSGPQPLIDLMEFTKDTINRRRGHKLTTLDLYDIICKIGQIVVSGGVRRSALISLSDLRDSEIRDAKKGAFWTNNSQRSMTNNSAVYNEKPTMIEFMNEWLSLAESGTGERGIFNRGDLAKVIPERRVIALGDDINHVGCNPCVTADTWVQTIEGPRQVLDLIGVKTELIVNGTLHLTDGFYFTGVKEVYELKTKRGHSLKLTSNHKLCKVINKEDNNNDEINKENWVELKDLKVGDEISLSNHRSLNEWKGAGSFVDGWVVGEAVATDNFKYLCNKYGVNGKSNFTPITEKTSSNFQRGLIKAFVAHSSYVKDNKYYIMSKNLNHLECLQRMLARMGVQSAFLLFTGQKVSHTLVISNDNIIIFNRLMEYSNKDTTPTSENHNLENFVDTIASITYVGEEKVYDVTVNDVHEFCANGIRAHNCGEILLKPMQFCNLSEVVCRAEDNLVSLMRKARVATIIGTYQSSLTDFKYINPKWKQNQEHERLLGVSLTGQWDCDAVRSEYAFKQLRDYCVTINAEYAKRFGINQSTSVTTTKPSGTVSQLTNASSGIHPRFSKYYIRRIRISATDPLLKLMRDQGYPCHPEVGQSEEHANTFVLDFPVKSPEGSVCVNDIGAIEQLEYWKSVKINYTEHNPSVTIYIKPNEWLKVGQWIWDNWEYITGLSFLPYSDHVYQLAPYEAITEEQYEKFKSKLNKIDFSKLVYYELTDSTDVKREVACAGGVCEL